MSDKWDKRYIDLAEFVAQWSKDPSTKTGAVIIAPENSVVSVGYNGLPRGIEDAEERLNNREIKYQIIVHCECNALIHAKRDISGCTLYTWPFMSCATCAAMMIQAGIVRCVAPAPNEDLLSRWAGSIDLATELYKESGVRLDLI